MRDIPARKDLRSRIDNDFRTIAIETDCSAYTDSPAFKFPDVTDALLVEYHGGEGLEGIGPIEIDEGGATGNVYFFRDAFDRLVGADVVARLRRRNRARTNRRAARQSGRRNREQHNQEGDNDCRGESGKKCAVARNRTISSND